MGEREITRNIGEASPGHEYIAFRVSQTKFNFDNKEISNSKEITKTDEPVVLYNHVLSKLDVLKIVDKILAKRRFSGAFSIFIVVPSLEDVTEDGTENYSKSHDSSIIIQSTGSNSTGKCINSVDPDSNLRTTSSAIRGVAICGKGKKFYMQEILSFNDKETMIKNKPLNVLRHTELRKNKLCQMNAPNAKEQTLENTDHICVIATDKTKDITCYCRYKKSTSADIFNLNCTSRDQSEASVISSQSTEVFLHGVTSSWFQSQGMRTPSTVTSVLSCDIPQCHGLVRQPVTCHEPSRHSCHHECCRHHSSHQQSCHHPETRPRVPRACIPNESQIKCKTPCLECGRRAKCGYRKCGSSETCAIKSVDRLICGCIDSKREIRERTKICSCENMCLASKLEPESLSPSEGVVTDITRLSMQPMQNETNAIKSHLSIKKTRFNLTTDNPKDIESIIPGASPRKDSTAMASNAATQTNDLDLASPKSSYKITKLISDIRKSLSSKIGFLSKAVTQKNELDRASPKRINKIKKIFSDINKSLSSIKGPGSNAVTQKNKLDRASPNNINKIPKSFSNNGKSLSSITPFPSNAVPQKIQKINTKTPNDLKSLAEKQVDKITKNKCFKSCPKFPPGVAPLPESASQQYMMTGNENFIIKSKPILCDCIDEQATNKREGDIVSTCKKLQCSCKNYQTNNKTDRKNICECKKTGCVCNGQSIVKIECGNYDKPRNKKDGKVICKCKQSLSKIKPVECGCYDQANKKKGKKKEGKKKEGKKKKDNKKERKFTCKCKKPMKNDKSVICEPKSSPGVEQIPDSVPQQQGVFDTKQKPQKQATSDIEQLPQSQLIPSQQMPQPWDCSGSCHQLPQVELTLPPEELPDGFHYEGLGPSCGWIDSGEIMKIRSELTVSTSGFKVRKRKKLLEYKKTETIKPDLVLEPEIDLDFEDAIRYFAILNPERFRELMQDEIQKLVDFELDKDKKLKKQKKKEDKEKKKAKKKEEKKRKEKEKAKKKEEKQNKEKEKKKIKEDKEREKKQKKENKEREKKQKKENKEKEKEEKRKEKEKLEKSEEQVNKEKPEKSEIKVNEEKHKLEKSEEKVNKEKEKAKEKEEKIIKKEEKAKEKKKKKEEKENKKKKKKEEKKKKKEQKKNKKKKQKEQNKKKKEQKKNKKKKQKEQKKKKKEEKENRKKKKKEEKEKEKKKKKEEKENKKKKKKEEKIKKKEEKKRQKVEKKKKKEEKEKEKKSKKENKEKQKKWKKENKDKEKARKKEKKEKQKKRKKEEKENKKKEKAKKKEEKAKKKKGEDETYETESTEDMYPTGFKFTIGGDVPIPGMVCFDMTQELYMPWQNVDQSRH